MERLWRITMAVRAVIPTSTRLPLLMQTHILVEEGCLHVCRS